MIRRQTLTSQVIEYILDLIRSGKVKPGERLPTEKELTATLAVSRTCVREGMKTLEFLRLVGIRPKVGAAVLEASPTTLLTAEYLLSSEGAQEPDTLVEFRKIIETGVVSLAAQKATAEDILAMRKTLDRYKQEMDRGKVDYRTDMSFHAEVAAASKNPLAIMTWEMISYYLPGIYAHTLQIPRLTEEALHDHLRILRAIEEHNPAKARAAMRSHMEHVDRVLRIIKAKQVSPALVNQKETMLPLKA